MAKGNQTGGRPKGTPDRLASDLLQMMLDALEDAGGRDYLRQQAEKTPSAFLALVGRIVSRSMSGRDAGPSETREMSDLEVARRLAFLLARGAEALALEPDGQGVLRLPNPVSAMKEKTNA